MMNDRELLELAAKAAGYECKWNPDDPFHLRPMHIAPNWQAWNPLDDDGDALRLAARLEIDVWHRKWPSGEKYAAAHKVWCRNDSMYYDDGVAYKNDKEAATRRAIVLAAAEIGRAMTTPKAN